MPPTRYREDQGKTADKYQFSSQQDTGHNAHDRQHAGSFKPLPVQLPQRTPHYEEICVPDPIEPPVVSVPDSGSTFALLGLAILIMVLRPK